MVLLYIDGKPTSPKKAKEYFIKAIQAQNNQPFINDNKQQEIDYTNDCLLQWRKKATSEEARDRVFNISAILEQGGIEVIIQTD